MATRQFQLSETQIKALQQQEQQTQRVAELKRLQAVRLYGSGRKLHDIMDMVSCGESSVRIWAMTYTREGLEGLLSGYEGSAQNARKLSQEQEAQLCELEACRGAGQFWTVDTVQAVVEKWYGVTYAYIGSYRNLLHRCGFSYQRSEQVYKSRPSAVAVADFEAELEKK